MHSIATFNIFALQVKEQSKERSKERFKEQSKEQSKERSKNGLRTVQEWSKNSLTIHFAKHDEIKQKKVKCLNLPTTW